MWAIVRAALRDDDAFDWLPTGVTWLASAPVDVQVLKVGPGLVVHIAVAAKRRPTVLDAEQQRLADRVAEPSDLVTARVTRRGAVD